MALEKLEALEARVRDLVGLVQQLRRANAALETEVRTVQARLFEQEESNRHWEEERAHIRSRIEKVLGELDFLECLEESKEVAVD